VVITVTIPVSVNDGYLTAFSDQGDAVSTVGDNVPSLNTSSQDLTEYLAGFPFPSASYLSGYTLSQFVASRFKGLISTKVNPSPLGNFGTWYTRIYNIMGNGQSLNYNDYNVGTIIDTDSNPGVGLKIIPFSPALLNLNAGVNGGYSNVTVNCRNGGEAGVSDSVYIYYDSATKAGGTPAVIEVDVDLGGGSPQRTLTGAGL